MELKKYTNGKITVFWRPKLCNHNGYCYNHLDKVFDPMASPWVDMNGATTEEIIDTVENCPTGALTFKYNTDMEETKAKEQSNSTFINVTPNGPFLLKGDFIIIDKDGKELAKTEKASLCRCGASKNQPFCDGKHKEINFTDKIKNAIPF